MLALYDYSSQGPEDLEFSEGDTIDILGEGEAQQINTALNFLLLWLSVRSVQYCFMFSSLTLSQSMRNGWRDTAQEISASSPVALPTERMTTSSRALTFKPWLFKS